MARVVLAVTAAAQDSAARVDQAVSTGQPAEAPPVARAVRAVPAATPPHRGARASTVEPVVLVAPAVLQVWVAVMAMVA